MLSQIAGKRAWPALPGSSSGPRKNGTWHHVKWSISASDWIINTRQPTKRMSHSISSQKNCLSSGRRTQPRIQHNDLKHRKFIDSALTHQMQLNERPSNGISRNRSNDSRSCDFSQDSEVILGRIHLSIIPPHLLSSGQKLWKSI